MSGRKRVLGLAVGLPFGLAAGLIVIGLFGVQ
jgi:hypothetical protein